MEKTLIIEGNRPVEILDGLRDIGILDEYSHLDTDNTKFEVKFKTQTPQFKVGMRVEFIAGDMIYKYKVNNKFTRNMIYRIAGYSCHNFYILDDNGIGAEISEKEMVSVFKPYEKPKEGDEYWVIDGTDDIVNSEWGDFAAENAIWNLGLAFHTKEQCEFARERLSKLF